MPTVQVSVKLPPRAVAALDRLTERSGRRRGAVISDALRLLDLSLDTRANYDRAAYANVILGEYQHGS